MGAWADKSDWATHDTGIEQVSKWLPNGRFLPVRGGSYREAKKEGQNKAFGPGL